MVGFSVLAGAEGCSLELARRVKRLRPAVNAPAHNETIHDFGDFPQALFDLQYPAPPAADLAHRVAELLTAGGMPTDIDTRRGLDHGAWAPLIVAWPDANVPVLQLSVQTRLGPEHHFRLGQLLARLREEGVLILGSGSFTHDLSSFRISGGRIDAPEQDWVRSFADWMVSALQEGRIDDLFQQLNVEALRFQEAYYRERRHLFALDRQRCSSDEETFAARGSG